MVRVSVIIPCRNEKDFIARCLDSITGNDYPQEDIEILVMDGMSDDGTGEILRVYAATNPVVRVVANPDRTAAAALNAGIRNATGSIIIRMDAHNLYDASYISRSVRYLEAYKVDNVGGVWITRPGSATPAARAIALATAQRFGVGNARYRTGVTKPVLVDTVPFGCYRKELFEKIGLFDREAIRNEDDEFNARITKNGGKILLAPDIISYYYARPDYTRIGKMFFQYGFFKPIVFRKLKTFMTLRQFVPAAFIISLLVSGVLSFSGPLFRGVFLLVAGSYLAGNLLCSLFLSAKSRWELFPHLMAAFVVIHAAYGIGFLLGAIRFLLLRRPPVADPEQVPLTR